MARGIVRLSRGCLFEKTWSSVLVTLTLSVTLSDGRRGSAVGDFKNLQGYWRNPHMMEAPSMAVAYDMKTNKQAESEE